MTHWRTARTIQFGMRGALPSEIADKFKNVRGRPKIIIPADELTIATVKEWLSYDPKTGDFVWLKDRGNHVRAGAFAGSPNNKGYLTTKLFGTRYQLHRLAWFFTHGVWPSNLIDHFDGKKANNVLSNLREATNAQNQHNRIAKGYSFDKREKRFKSSIEVNKKVIWLGYFSTEEDARAAYLAAHAEHFGEFSVTRRLTAGRAVPTSSGAQE